MSERVREGGREGGGEEVESEDGSFLGVEGSARCLSPWESGCTLFLCFAPEGEAARPIPIVLGNF